MKMGKIGMFFVSALAAVSLYFSGCQYVAHGEVQLGDGYSCAGRAGNVQLYKGGRLVAKKKRCGKSLEKEVLCFYENGRKFAETGSGQCRMWRQPGMDDEETYDRIWPLELKLAECEAVLGGRDDTGVEK
jgi:hypothetical protein